MIYLQIVLKLLGIWGHLISDDSVMSINIFR